MPYSIVPKTIDSTADWMQSAKFVCDGNVIVAPTRQPIRLIEGTQVVREFGDQCPELTEIAVHPSGKIFVSTFLSENDRGQLLFWEIETGKCLQTIELDAAPGRVRFSRDGGLLAVACNFATLYVFETSSASHSGFEADRSFTMKFNWSPPRKSLIHDLAGPGSWVYDVDIHGKTIAACFESCAYLIDFECPEQPRVVSPYPESDRDDPVMALRLSPHSNLIAMGTITGHVVLRDFDGNFRGDIRGHGSKLVGDLAFSADGSLLAIASGATQCQIKVARVAYSSQENALRFITPLHGHTRPVNSLEFDSDHWLLSASSDGSAKLWDLGRFSQAPSAEAQDVFSRLCKQMAEQLRHFPGLPSSTGFYADIVHIGWPMVPCIMRSFLSHVDEGSPEALGAEWQNALIAITKHTPDLTSLTDDRSIISYWQSWFDEYPCGEDPPWLNNN
jgi:WD40 repeat protein